MPLKAVGRENDILGTVLLADEGMNGTLSGSLEGLETFFATIKKDARFATLEPKYNHYSAEEVAGWQTQPFEKLKIRLKREIVALKKPVDVKNQVGTYVKPEDWNALISDPRVRVVDTRNRFEVDMGKFKNAVNPQTERFSELPVFVEAALAHDKDAPVAMYCTGGIRCEKSTSYLLSQGFKNVYHLEGGILGYLETIPREESLWEGECFVFDERISV